MISFSDVYERAFNLIDDPDISRAYINNPIQFQRIMYNFLKNGIAIITAPTSVCDSLAVQSEPHGETQTFDGAGTDTYEVGIIIPDTAETACYIEGRIDSNAKIVKVAENKYNVVFSRVIQVGETCAVEYYENGSFDADFSKISGKMPVNALEQRVIDMLARATIISWADKEKNFLLDIRNLLNDTDFKLHSPANSLQSKEKWVAGLRDEIFNLQTKLSWDMRNRARSYYGY